MKHHSTLELPLRNAILKNTNVVLCYESA
jgi:hypothetical protein